MAQTMVAATQMACTPDPQKNIKQAKELVREAAGKGAQIILIQELFETPYFCKDQKKEFFAWARPVEDNPVLAEFQELAKSLGVVLPFSFFERANNAYYNSLVMIDADGQNLGLYRKAHIPDGPGYQEKFYFNPGDTGFQVFPTRYGKVGCAICWDQWFPEAARVMALKGADLLMYPTAIGSEPQDHSIDSAKHWQTVMQGHAGANLVPLVASNRIGLEKGEACDITFYGHSFIADVHGQKVQEFGRTEQGVLVAGFDFDENRATRAAWGVFRDRRPGHYRPILSLDGRNQI